METFLDVLMMIGSALFMIFFFGACIFIHELGHFLAGRMCGLRVKAFSIGFRKIWAKKINGVEYRIGWIPFGGYVDLPQIDATDDEIKDDDGTVLPKAEPWKRMVTAFAGPFFNILFGLALGIVIWIAGLPQESPLMSEFKVKTVEENSPEYIAGLRPGDVIVKRNGQTFKSTWGSFARDIMLNIGETTLTVQRDGKEMDFTYLPGINKNFAPGEDIPYPFFRPEIPVIVFPSKDSPAARAGIRENDRILAVNGKEIFGVDEFYSLVHYSQGKTLVLTVADSGGAERQVTVTPEPVKNAEKASAWMTGIAFNPGTGGLVVQEAMMGLPAETLIMPGDKVISVNGEACNDIELFRKAAKESEGRTPLSIVLLRGEKEVTVSLAPVYVVPHQIGVSFRIMTHPNPFRQFKNVLELTWRSMKSVGAGIGRAIGLDSGYTALGPKHLSGPVGIGRYLYVSVYHGSLILGLNLVVLLTFNLGLLNLLPIPILDGGHIVLALLETIFRRPVPAKVLQPIAYAFVAFLIAFMLFVTFYDVKKLIPAKMLEKAKTETVDAEK